SIVSNASGSPCSGQTNVIYTVVPVSGASTFTWTVPAGWTIVSGQGTPSITVTAGSTAGNVSVVAENGCGSSTASTLAQTPTTTTPTAPGQIAGNIAPCSGSTLNVYSIPVVTGATNYIWAVPAGWVITSGQGTTTITVTAGSVNGNISVMAANGCGPGDPSVLPVQAPSTAPVTPGPISGSTSICINQTSVTYSIASVTGASGYTWTVPAGWTITAGQNTNSITVTVGTTPGTISVAATNGCATGTATTLALTPTTTPPVTPGAISGNTVPCTGQSNVTYSIANVTGAASYTWTVPAGWTITSGQGTNSITVNTGNAAGNVEVSAVNSCGPGTASVLAVTPSSTAAPATGPIAGNTVPCISQNGITYSIAPVVGASSYAWTLPGGWVITSGQGTTTITVTAGSTSGNVTVTAANGCGTGVPSDLAVSPAFTPPAAPVAISGNSVPCSAGGTLTYSVPVVGSAASYTWAVPTGWTIASGQGTNTITVNPGAAGGAITVFASNGCGDSAPDSLQVMISQTTPPTPGPITAPFSGSPCAGQTGLVYSIAPVTGASSYNWTVPTGWTITAGQGTSSITVTAGTTAGNVEVTAANGCGAGSASLLGTTPTNTPPLSSGTIAGSAMPCVGNVATIFSTTAVNGATGYTWTVPAGWVITSGQGTPTITVTPGSTAGLVSVEAQNGCGSGVASTLQVSPTTLTPANAGPITGNANICSNQTGLVYEVAPVTGATDYSWTVPAGWTIIKGAGTSKIEVKAGATGGDITVTAQNDCGSSDLAVLAVAIKPALTLAGAIKDESSACSGLRYTVAHLEGATNYNWTLPAGWQIISGQGTNSIQVTATSQSGTITVTAQNAGCTSEPLTISANSNASASDLDIPNAFSPNNDGINEQWEIKNLENYPHNEVTIINRWGTEVFREKGYKNTWNGQSLSAGTYYYILQVKQCDNTEVVRKGYLTIVR
ncbi:MAG TPA: gliding motility-associated C-terminal domain-containing protein, partial [Adhaeribacter sp.]|nr:gliding motility-associated C-terminal domain-containing protein [Adhaeribacter sp.]